MIRKAIASVAFLACGVVACGAPDRNETDTPSAVDSFADTAAPSDVCWRPTTVRGAGTIPSECPGEERNGALCYPRCPAGYTGAGPVCWQSCSPGYTDDGALCRRDAQIISSDNGQCPWYDKCGITLAKGCSKCPAGFANDGCTCRRDVNIVAKQTQTRGAGRPMSCAAGSYTDAGLCYPACPSGTSGVGPVCWSSCASDMPVACGAGCARSSDACARATTDQVLKPIETVVKAVEQDWPGAVEKGLETANAYNLPLCGGR